MRQKLKKGMMYLLMLSLLVGLTACGGNQKDTASKEEMSEVAGDYYLDLSELGMNLTIYLRLEKDGRFQFSNTLDFEVDKSSGTFTETETGYMMVFESVNGEEKSVSDGITSSFFVTEEGALDFSGCDKVPYGSANIITVSSEDETIRLMANPVTEDDKESTEKSKS